VFRRVWAAALPLLAAVLLPLTPRGAAAGDSVGILVLKEHGVGSPTLVQPYLDRFVAIAAQLNDWPAAKGQYHATRAAAEAYIAADKPHYGILSLAAFLAFKPRYDMAVIGQVDVSLAGGRQYHLISKQARDLAGCKGQTLASDHIDDPRFIDRVVAGGQFTLKDFKLLQTQRPLQTIKKVTTGEAVCGLIDEAQLAELSHIEGIDGVHPVWKSALLPPMVVVAFASAPSDERKTFQEHLDEICDGDAKGACAEVGITALQPADGGAYAAVLAAYGK